MPFEFVLSLTVNGYSTTLRFGFIVRYRTETVVGKNAEEQCKVGQLRIVRGLSRRTAGECGGTKRYRRCGVRKQKGEREPGGA